MKSIVTIKIKGKKKEKQKRSGACPLYPFYYCSDVNGEHHSIIIQTKIFQEIIPYIKIIYGNNVHITRIEVIEF